MTLRPRRRGRLIASAAALCVGVVGCGPTPDAEQPAASSPARPSSAPTPSASPSASARPSASASVSGSWVRERELDRYWRNGSTPSATASPSASTASRAQPAASSSSPAPDDVLPASRPTRVRVPSLGIDSSLIELGLQDDRTVEVPPTAPGSPAGWYENSPTPGSRGPAVLLGHVSDTEDGTGVFGHLKDIQPGALVEVDRADGTTAVFRVDRAVSYDRGGFPKDEVYGNTDDAQLRLITCDSYNAWTGHWDNNFVAFATLVR